jgi:Flp pilus assembly protein TadD
MTAHSGFIAAALVAGALATTACSNNDKSSKSAAAKPDSVTPKTAATSYAPEAPVVAPEPPKPITFRDGEAAFHAGNFSEATAMFTRLTEEKPGNAWGHFMLGLSASKAGDVATATKAFDEALMLDPNHVKTLLNSARLLIDQKKPDEALPRLDHALVLEPDSNVVHRLFARAYYSQGNMNEAIASYEQAIALDPDDYWSLNNLGLLLFEEGRAADAVPLLTKAVELQQGNATFANNLGMALEHTGQFQAAASAYRGAVDADPANEKAKRNLARVEHLEDVSKASAVTAGTPKVVEESEAQAGLR